MARRWLLAVVVVMMVRLMRMVGGVRMGLRWLRLWLWCWHCDVNVDLKLLQLLIDQAETRVDH